MRWYIVVCLVVLLIAVTWKELSAKNRRRSQSRIKDMIRKGKHFASQLKQKGTKKRGWWRSPVSKDEAQSSQKSTRRASRRKAGGRRKMQSLSSKRKSSKRHRSRHRGGSLRASSWRNTNRRKSFSKAQGRKKGTNKKTGRKNSVEGNRSKNRERNPKNKEDTRITNGLFTYKVEGDNNMLSRKFSRRTRVLGRKGGIVIGRGYDLSKRTSKQIYQTMIKAGVSKYTATNLAGAAGLTGQRAKSYIQEHLFNIVISSVQQRRLFKIMVQELEESLKKLFRYHILVKRFGKLNWKLLSHPIKEIVIDLRFRGEFMPPARRTILPSIVGNHLLEFTIHMNNRTLWKHVPRKRFELRAKYLKSESRKRYSATKLKMCYSYDYCKGAPENRS